MPAGYTGADEALLSCVGAQCTTQAGCRSSDRLHMQSANHKRAYSSGPAKRTRFIPQAHKQRCDKAAVPQRHLRSLMSMSPRAWARVSGEGLRCPRDLGGECCPGLCPSNGPHASASSPSEPAREASLVPPIQVGTSSGRSWPAADSKREQWLLQPAGRRPQSWGRHSCYGAPLQLPLTLPAALPQC